MFNHTTSNARAESKTDVGPYAEPEWHAEPPTPPSDACPRNSSACPDCPAGKRPHFLVWVRREHDRVRHARLDWNVPGGVQRRIEVSRQEARPQSGNPGCGP